MAVGFRRGHKPFPNLAYPRFQNTPARPCSIAKSALRFTEKLAPLVPALYKVPNLGPECQILDRQAEPKIYNKSVVRCGMPCRA